MAKKKVSAKTTAISNPVVPPAHRDKFGFLKLLIKITVSLISLATLYFTWDTWWRQSAQEIRINQAREVSRQEILRELQMGRDIISYGLLYHRFEPQWRRPVLLAPLSLQDRISEIFASNQTLAAEVSKLYKSLHVGIAQLQGLDSFPRMKPRDYVKKVLAALNATVKEADRVGPRVAQDAGGKWETPPPGYSHEQLVGYYEDRLPQVATDSYYR